MRHFATPNIILLGLLSLSCLAMLAGCHTGESKAETRTSPLALTTEPVSTAAFPRTCDLPGTIISDDRFQLSSRVVGFIRRLDVREGQRVSKGQLLVQIDPIEVEQAIKQGHASVDAAGKDLEDAAIDVEKFEKLAKTGAIATEAYRKAKVRRDIAESTLTKAKAGLVGIKSQSAYTEIRSPVDGVVITRHKQSGDLTVTGVPILTVESRRTLLFQVYVPESQIREMAVGMSATLRIDAMPERSFEGTIQRIVPSGDPVTRRYEVDVTVPTDPGLLPGMFGRAEIGLGKALVLAIPSAARVQRGGLGGVFVVDQGNVARFRWLRFGREWNGLVEVTAGLSEGERIVAAVDQRVKDGVPVAQGASGSK